MPSTLGRFAFTGNTVPPNGLLIRFQRIARPTLPAVSDAPMTATLRGRKIASSGCRGSTEGFGLSGLPVLLGGAEEDEPMCALPGRADLPRDARQA